MATSCTIYVTTKNNMLHAGHKGSQDCQGLAEYYHRGSMIGEN